ncbi:MAG: hypothetical protein CL472_01245 [Acidobacteria bacterium]|nr:hypothetical protein [Acidobacteriota bacterium]
MLRPSSSLYSDDPAMSEKTENHYELERLLALGHTIPKNPTSRELLIASLLDPSAWSVTSSEHIEWCRKNSLLHSYSHFGARFMRDRQLSLIKAIQMIRHLERHDAGKPEIKPFNAREASNALRKLMEEVRLENEKKRPADRVNITFKPVDSVRLMSCLNDIPAPAMEVFPNGNVELTWSEDGKSVRMMIENLGELTLKVTPGPNDPFPICLDSWKKDTDIPLILALTDWVYFNEPYPIQMMDNLPNKGPLS